MLSAEWGTEVGGVATAEGSPKLTELAYQAKTFSMGQRLPVSIIMHFKNGRYAIDSDKSIDLTSDSNVLGEYVRWGLLSLPVLVLKLFPPGPSHGEALDD